MGSTGGIHLLSIVGTRPEAIKIAPVALAAQRRKGILHRILATGQHDALFDDALAGFGLVPDLRLPPILRDPDPDILTERLVTAIEPILQSHRPDLVVVQGDTSSALSGAIAAVRLGIPVAHVEAGLRSFDMLCPWPEERNRVIVDRLSALLFAPTPEAAANLVGDRDVTGIVHVTGNTGIDALLLTRAGLGNALPVATDDPALILFTCHRRENVGFTCHRRENVGAGIDRICDAMIRPADRGDVLILCPLHPNPAVGKPIRRRLGQHPAIRLLGALPYRETVAAMTAARIILTDSGGIQEEAPALGIPTLVLRDVTERPEALATGNLALVGTDPDTIVTAVSRLLDHASAHAEMARPAFPFGRGNAAEKILDGVEQYFSSGPPHEHPLPFRLDWIKDGGPKGA